MNPRIYRRFVIWGVIVFAIQVLILNNTYFLAFLNPRGMSIFQPMIYPLLLMLLPFNFTRTTLLLMGFGVGLIMDVMCQSYGFHTLSCVVAVNSRNMIIRNLDLSQNLLESDNSPTINILGFYPFLIYTIIFLAIHHIIYFLVQSFSISSFLYNVVVTISSLLVSVILVLFWEMIMENDSKKSKSPA